MVLRLVQFAGEPRDLGFLTGSGGVRLRTVAASRLAPKHRRIAHPGQVYADCGLHNGITAGCCTAAILSSCPLWVKSRHQGQLNECPLYPQKRTLVEAHFTE